LLDQVVAPVGLLGIRGPGAERAPRQRQPALVQAVSASQRAQDSAVPVGVCAHAPDDDTVLRLLDEELLEAVRRCFVGQAGLELLVERRVFKLLGIGEPMRAGSTAVRSP
jgi:hypothetical protein